MAIFWPEGAFFLGDHWCLSSLVREKNNCVKLTVAGVQWESRPLTVRSGTLQHLSESVSP